jgi:uncharacterized protein (TIGR02145 family)
MKKTMKNQSKRFPLWGFKGLLSVALSSLAVVAFAQAADVCQGSGYTIADAVPASAGSEYRWLENGNVLANTNQATYNVPANKVAGVYTYVRQSKSAACPDWQSSNEFTVTVFNCTFTPPSTVTGTTAIFTDPRDGKKYKTVVMPDGRTWFAQNLNYTKDLVFNMYASEANGQQFTSMENGVPAIGSYWCPGAHGSTYSGDQNMCNVYGALYTWETAMMVDGKYADETKMSSAWDENWVSPYYFSSGAPGTNPNADVNNARGGTNVKRGGRGICPMGWHVPTIREWAIMLDKVEGSGNETKFNDILMPSDKYYGTDAGVKLKSASTYTGVDPSTGSWEAQGNPGVDLYNYSVVPAGVRYPWTEPTSYSFRGYDAFEVNSSAENSLKSYDAVFRNNMPNAGLVALRRSAGRTVRCLKD